MSDDWTQAFYETPIAAAILTRSAPEVEKVADRVAAWLELGPGARVFEQCCGSGEVALALSRRGHDVVGVDISGPFIDAATRVAKQEGLQAQFARADASEWVSPRPCDAGFNWGTGFGCSAQDADNLGTLASACASLEPGAPFLLDYYNVAGVLAGFRESFEYTRDFEGRPVTVRRESELHLEAGLMKQQWWFIDGDQTVKMPKTTTRLYLPKELLAMLEAAGLHTERVWGDHEGGPLTLDSPRCVVLARKRG